MSDSSAIWSIVSIVVSSIVAVLIYKLQKIKKYPSQLSYTILNKTKVLQNVPGSFNDLSLRYNNYSISQELHYIELMVFNPRTSDVGNAESNSSIIISLPSKSKWIDVKMIDVKIKKESPSVGSSVSVSKLSPSDAELQFRLLKENESIIIEGLVESLSLFPIPEGIVLAFSHRIPNLDRLHYLPNVSEYEMKRSKSSVKWLVILVLSILLTACFRLAMPQYSRVYYVDSLDNEVYSVAMNKDQMVVVNTPNGNSFKPKLVIPFNDFLTRFTPVSQYKKNYNQYIMPSLFLLMCVLMIALSLEEFDNLRRYRKLKRIKNAFNQ